MAFVYDKVGKPIPCDKKGAEILIKSGHFTKNKPAVKKPEKNTGKD